jgi:HEPN domain-containing protein
MADQHDLARELLDRAQDDHVAAQALLDVPAVSEAIVGFHAQQAVEKAFKAVLAHRGVTFPFTHNIGLLMTLIEDAGILDPPSLADVDLLTPYGVALRYGAKSPGTVDRRAERRRGRPIVVAGGGSGGPAAECLSQLLGPKQRSRDDE